MLGFKSYAELSLAPKMADSPQQVLAFLDDLAARAKPFAERDYDELSRFARDELGLDRAGGLGHRLGIGEAARWRATRSPSRRSSSTFPEHRVLPGMFRLVETLYGIRIAPAQAPAWHPDVRFFDIRNARRRADRPVLPRPVRAPVQARRRVDGRRHHAQATRQPRADAGRLSHLQLLGAGRRTPGAVHAQRSHHAVPRVRPRAASPAHARRAPRRVGHQRRGMGRGGAAQPVHGELLLGMGRARGHDRACGQQAGAAARAVRQDAGGQEFPERPAVRAPARVRAVRHASASRLRTGGRR